LRRFHARTHLPGSIRLEHVEERLKLRQTVVLTIAVCGLTAWATPAAQVDDSYRVLGSPDSPVEITIYSDFECPYCRNFALAAVPAIVAEFVHTGRVRLRYAFFPLAALHPNSVATAKAAHCAGLAGRFWSYHDYLFVRQPEWAGEPRPDSLWIAYAENLDIDPEPFAACLSSEKTHAFIEESLRDALASGASGTPTVVVNGESVTGFSSYEELRAAILSAIAAANEQSPDP
jgi:protein-disulfide isomerase